jgi:hypothetical protein
MTPGLHRPFQVGKPHRHLLVLAFDGGLGAQDLLGQMTRSVAEQWLEMHGAEPVSAR